jgi:ubiquinone/menaquinone biosynthesis C-methylase UbiE
MESISFDRAAEYYDATRGYPPGIDDQIADALIMAADATMATRFVESGIGTGRIALPLITRGYDYAGIDLAPAMMAQLRHKLAAYDAAHPAHPPFRLDLRAGDSTRLPYADASFDVALTVHVLHLIPNWRDALSEVLRVLKPGGWYLNGGDEGADSGKGQPSVQELWLEGVRDLAPDIGNMARAGYSTSQEIIRDLTTRGLSPERLRTVTWTVEDSPHDIVDYIKQRRWSRTWLLPDDVFAESVRRLEASAPQVFGERYDQPQPHAMQFVITRARKT